MANVTISYKYGYLKNYFSVSEAYDYDLSSYDFKILRQVKWFVANLQQLITGNHSYVNLMAKACVFLLMVLEKETKNWLGIESHIPTFAQIPNHLYLCVSKVSSAIELAKSLVTVEAKKPFVAFTSCMQFVKSNVEDNDNIFFIAMTLPLSICVIVISTMCILNILKLPFCLVLA